MEVSIPIFMFGIKDNNFKENADMVKKHIAIEIILNMLIGKSSKLYAKLYERGLLFAPPDSEYEFSKQFAHILISGQSPDPKKIYDLMIQEIENMKNNEINTNHFQRIKNKIYGDYAVEYNNVANIGRMFAADYAKGINSFDYMEKFDEIDENYLKKILKNVFKKENIGISIIKGK